MARRKKSERRKLKDKCEKLAKTIVKIRDDYTCQMCHKRIEGVNCHGSHVIPVSRCGVRLSYDPINLKVLCYHCHLNIWHKEPTYSGKWFREKFPERMEYLEEKMKIPPSPVSMIELQEIHDNLKEQLAALS